MYVHPEIFGSAYGLHQFRMRRIELMNMAIRGIDADFGEHQADTFTHDLHPTLKADFILANEAVICGLIPEKACNFKEFAA